MTTPPERIVKLKTAISLNSQAVQKTSPLTELNLTFRSIDKSKPVTAEDYGVVDATKAQQLNLLLTQLTAFNDVFFQWLETDANNAILFANEPVKALKLALPEFDESLLLNLNDVFAKSAG